MAWMVYDIKGPATKAVATRAAPGASLANVCTSITYSLVNMAAPAAFYTILILRDGASGTGALLWQAYVGVPAVNGEAVVQVMSDLYIVGSANTQMTLEFSIAATTAAQSVTMTGDEVAV